MLLQQPSISPKTLPKPLLPHSHLPKNLRPQFPYHIRRTSFLLRASASASPADTKSLPQSAIRRIADKLRSLGYVEDSSENQQPSPPQGNLTLTTSPGEIFVPLPNRLPKYRVGHTLDPSWTTPENPVPEPGSGNAIRRYHELRREVWKEKKEEKDKRRMEGNNTESEKVPTMAELKLPREELRRLRSLGIAIKTRLKIGKAGITEGIVNGIHERWRRNELVKIVCEDMSRLNMKRTHDLLERKTGGLVIWRSGSIIILYRGADYKYPYFFTSKRKPDDASVDDPMSASMDSEEGSGEESYLIGTKTTQPPLIQGVGSRTRVRFQLPGEAQLAEESNQLLDGLGPRFTDWYGYEPLPVDADLLPAVVPGYRKPFRLLPFGVQPKLTNDEMTILRRLGRPLPCHFALGRNRKLQGLAAAILKLWEKCEIAKIAVKRGVQNTNSDLMAEELKWLTGGTLLTRDKEYIVLYRGKDFLPATVSSAIEQRRDRGVDELVRKKRASSSDVQENKDKEMENSSAAEISGIRDQKLEIAIEQRKQRSREAAIKKTSSKLSEALANKERAEKLLEELEKEETKQPLEADKEGITEEERYMLRKVGMKMRPFLLLGRRGVFDGTVENMHLHWKYRELVKILCGSTSIDEVHAIARTLESESGGILVAVERMRKGHAIIVYRGKNYKRPASLRPQTLLNKREALKRSIEAQRRESLKLQVLKLGKNVEGLKLKLARSEEINTHGEKDENIQLEQEITTPSAEYMEPVSDVELHKSNPIDQDNEQARDLQEGALDFPNKDDSLNTSQENPTNESEKDKIQNTSISSDALKLEESPSTELCVSVMRSEVPLSLVKEPQLKESNGKPHRSVLLSNKERLLLRKQALNMKKRPVLAVGRSNIVSGVAKTIKTHFQKHPLAIVNIKGRAKGTSAQEVVSMLEWLTGGTLLTRDKEYIVLYRGKDFLPATVSSAIEQRRDRGVDELVRKKRASSSDVQENKDKEMENSSAAEISGIRDQKLEIAIEQRKQRSREAAIKKTSSKLSQALASKERAEKLLEELEKEETKQPLEADKEGITEEERYMLRKVGMKMRPFLLLGRRGVFDGTVENMHLHWKYRELVKILCGSTNIDEVHAIARTLESESGGILVAVERMRKGHAIIVYRGKNYKRPASLRPQTLLNKREALKRSIEAQRRESLKLQVLKLGKNVEGLKLKLARSEEINTHGEKDENIQLEQEITTPSAEYMEPVSDVELHKLNPTDQDNEQARDLQEGALDFPNKDDSLNISQENPTDESEFKEANSTASSLLVEGTNESEKDETQNTSISSDVLKLEESPSTELCVSVMRSEVSLSPVKSSQLNESNRKPHRSVLLSNKERLLLRKQALNMKKRPVLAVGRSNIVSGVAKTIKTHFQKHPLAIVNIRGRAKGTSAQEVVSMLEDATGAILVSQEPNKVILYRGWGAATTHDSNQTNRKREPNDREDIVKPIISPELISAIRIECGLQDYKVQENEVVS
ncbi:hypothetical protein SSX86_016154 [Deinandra increscens subsp. villosa]|uniref:CRM domain-containing protein n=1 Tax=Deinandra increscens subsp. villosa TaxID=3103831 RepID=A0AAP0D2R9_9ASTR